MGLDGGSIPSRADILRRSSWRLANAKNVARSTRGGQIGELVVEGEQSATQKLELLKIKWTICALSGLPLREPIVACELGKIYNRESVIEFLLGTGQFEYKKEKLKNNGFGHITSIKNLIELYPTRNAQWKELEIKEISSLEVSAAEMPSPFVCPISGTEANGRHPFCALRSCGHCFNEKALKEATGKIPNCPMCNKEYTKDDVLILNGTEEQIEIMEKESKRKREEEGSKKKQKKEKKNKKDKKEKSKKKEKNDITKEGEPDNKKRKKESHEKDGK